MGSGHFQKSRHMSRRQLVKISLGAIAASVFALALGCATKPTKAAEKPPVISKPVAPVIVLPPPPAEKLPPVMLGIDVLEADGFKAIVGKKIGLLTHRAGVNRRGESTINVLRRAPQSKLVCLFAPENGLDGQTKSATRFDDAVHAATGLPVYSLYGKTKQPTPAQLKGLDAVVIDLQDIGSRSYTFISWMRYTLEACFTAGVEVIVLDRPNPLGGLKVDGPPLDGDLMTDVGAFRVPYVHGLTMGELATMARQAPGVLKITEKIRTKGRLTVIPMRGWTRAMRWPDTELRWIATSPLVTSFEATVGYAMVGLGCEQTSWSSGIGKDFPFRGISYPRKTPDEIITALNTYKIPGIKLVKKQGLATDGKFRTGVYVEVSDWEKWNPTELSFYMHKQAARWERLNPFAGLTTAEQRTFKIHVGSNAWFAELQRAGAQVDVTPFLQNWAQRAAVYQTQTRKFWLYP